MTIPPEATASLPAPIVHALRAFIRRARRLIVIRGACATVAMTFGAFMVVMLIDAGLTLFAAWPRWLLTLAAYAASVATAIVYIVRPLARSFTLAGAARLIEAHHPELQERISSAVELLSSRDLPSLRGSDALIGALTEEAVRDAAGVRPKREVSFKAAIPFLLGAAAVAVILGTLLALRPTQTRFLLARAAAPFLNLPNVHATELAVVPGDACVTIGSRLTISVTTGNRVITRVRLLQTTASGGEQAREMVAVPSVTNTPGSTFAITLPNLTQSFQYRIHAGDAVTRFYRVDVAVPPILQRLAIRYHFPPYVGLADAEDKEALGTIRALAGTEVTVSAKVNKPCAAATLQITAASATNAIAGEMRKDGETVFYDFRFTLPPRLAGIWTLCLKDDFGLTNAPFERTIQASADRPPVIRTPELNRPELHLNRDDRLPIAYAAEDDFGLHEIRLLVSVDGTNLPHRVLPLPATNAAIRMVRDRTELDLSDSAFATARKVRFSLLAADGVPPSLHGPQTGTTDVHTIVFEAQAQSWMVQSLESQKQSFKQTLEQVREMLRTAREAEQSAVARMAKENTLAAETSKMLDRIQDRLGNARETLGQTGEQLRNGYFQKLAEQAEEVANEQLAKAEESAGQIAQTSDPSKRAELAADTTKRTEASLAGVDDMLRQLDPLANTLKQAVELDRMAARQTDLARTKSEMDQGRSDAATNAAPALPTTNEWKAAEERLADNLARLAREMPQVTNALAKWRNETAAEAAQAAADLTLQQSNLAETVKQQLTSLQSLDKSLGSLAERQDRLADAARSNPTTAPQAELMDKAADQIKTDALPEARASQAAAEQAMKQTAEALRPEMPSVENAPALQASKEAATRSAQEARESLNKARQATEQANRSANEAGDRAAQAQKHEQQAVAKGEKAQLPELKKDTEATRQEAKKAAAWAQAAQQATEKAHQAADAAQEAAAQASRTPSPLEAEAARHRAAEAAERAAQEARNAQTFAREAERQATPADAPRERAQQAASNADADARKAEQAAQTAREAAEQAKASADKTRRDAATPMPKPEDTAAAAARADQVERKARQADTAATGARQAADSARKAAEAARDAARAAAEQKTSRASQTEEAAKADKAAAEATTASRQAEQLAQLATDAARDAAQEAARKPTDTVTPQERARQAAGNAEADARKADQAAQTAQEAAGRAKAAAEDARRDAAAPASHPEDKAATTGRADQAERQARTAKAAATDARQAADTAKKASETAQNAARAAADQNTPQTARDDEAVKADKAAAEAQAAARQAGQLARQAADAARAAAQATPAQARQADAQEARDAAAQARDAAERADRSAHAAEADADKAVQQADQAKRDADQAKGQPSAAGQQAEAQQSQQLAQAARRAAAQARQAALTAQRAAQNAGMEAQKAQTAGTDQQAEAARMEATQAAQTSLDSAGEAAEAARRARDAAKTVAAKQDAERAGQLAREQEQIRTATEALLAEREQAVEAVRRQQMAVLRNEQERLAAQADALAKDVAKAVPEQKTPALAASEHAGDARRAIADGQLPQAADAARGASQDMGRLAGSLRDSAARLQEQPEPQATQPQEETATPPSPAQVAGLAQRAAAMADDQGRLARQMAALNAGRPLEALAREQATLASRIGALEDDVQRLRKQSSDVPLPGPATAPLSQAADQMNRAQDLAKDAEAGMDKATSMPAKSEAPARQAAQSQAQAAQQLAQAADTLRKAEAATAKAAAGAPAEPSEQAVPEALDRLGEAAQSQDAMAAIQAADALAQAAERAGQQARAMGGNPAPSSPRMSLDSEGGINPLEPITEEQASLMQRLGLRLRDWLRLPGELRDDVRQGTQTEGPEEYRPLIKRYFREVSRQGGQE